MQAAQADHAGTRITVAADAADAYLQIRGYQTRLAIAQSQVDTNAQLLRLVQSRYRAGQGDGREVAQAQALPTDARTLIPTLRMGLEAQMNRLDVLLGARTGNCIRAALALEEAGVPYVDRHVDLRRGEQRRPEFAALNPAARVFASFTCVAWPSAHLAVITEAAIY